MDSSKAAEEVRDFDTMVFDTYRPRAGWEARGYDQWLRDVDYDVFARLTGIVAGYYCCKVLRSVGALGPYGVGKDLPYTHFGAIGLESADSYEAMMADPGVQAHVPVWVDNWAIHPDAEDMGENFHFSLARRGFIAPGPRTNLMILLPYALSAVPETSGIDIWANDPAAVRDMLSGLRLESWYIEAPLLGDYKRYSPAGLDRIFVDDAATFDALAPYVSTAVLGEVIVGPTALPG